MSSISSLNSNSAISVSCSAQTRNNGLSEETKAKLLSLGIDPSTVSSETEAQSLIAQVEAMSKSDKARPQTSSSSSEQTLISKARQLAEKVGVQVSQTDTLDEMCSKISQKIETLSEQYSSDTGKQNTIQGYSDELAAINSKYAQIQNNHQSIYAAMNMISLSNKYALGLN